MSNTVHTTYIHSSINKHIQIRTQNKSSETLALIAAPALRAAGLHSTPLVHDNFRHIHSGKLFSKYPRSSNYSYCLQTLIVFPLPTCLTT